MQRPEPEVAMGVKVDLSGELAAPAATSSSLRRRVVAVVAVSSALLACVVLAVSTAVINSEEDSVNNAMGALPRRASEMQHSGCRDVAVGEPCHRHVTWAMQSGIKMRPEWYAGLTAASTFKEFQAVLHADRFADCPQPCGLAPMPAAAAKASKAANETVAAEGGKIGWQPQGQLYGMGQWCSAQAPSADWQLKSCGQLGGARVKVLTYNLFWWNLFGLRGGADRSAGRLIASAHEGEPYDLMGFQECEDVNRMLQDAGLQDQFIGIPGSHALALAYRKDAWSVLSHSSVDVAEDGPDQWYGTRAGQWARLRHLQTGSALFFVVHHGPLPVGSGGRCGSEATAYNIMKLIATNASPQDAILLVGDFNSGLGTDVVNRLQGPLHKVHSGSSFGGVDHIYSSCDNVTQTRNLGGGGSDHDALDAVIGF